MKTYRVDDLIKLNCWQDILQKYHSSLSKDKRFITLPSNFFDSNNNNCGEESKPIKEVIKGLGDVIEKLVAHPIAKTIDRVAGTHINNGCGGCNSRQNTLNKILPFKDNN